MKYYQECIALGSKTGIALVTDDEPAVIEELYRKLWRAVFVFEKRFSRFIPDSELSMFNRSAGVTRRISEEFRSLLLAARTLAIETDGLYNPFILPAVQSAGYLKSRVPGHEDDAVDDYSQRAIGAVEELEIGDNWARIPYGTAIDLGGCGKGYLADQLRGMLPAFVQGYWVSLGGDIAVGGKNENQKPWDINVESAEAPEHSIAAFSASRPCGIATSGVTVHRGEHKGRQWHHLIDPRTHRPAVTDVLLASVQDDSSLRADVLASCAVIIGSADGMKFLKDKGVSAALIQYRTASGRVRTKQFGALRTAGVAHA